ncbi:NAD-dependent malic enzyme [uncultured Corynebacterium sp.]|uniref:NAD-dependent malic enzyme n=1 Tax=uncultured Corynebacterium sp. TaxID=159447 RepID=UPI0025D2A13B|nr:NAD-dependent malic enzyme [uncultured Corynebacterium sp.]
MSIRPNAITDPHINRGTAYTYEERKKLGLTGRLPSGVETLESQAQRCYQQLSQFENNLNKYHYLDELHGRNETVYFKLLVDHLKELLPIVYDPTIGDAIENWSQDYRRSHAVYLSIDRVDEIRESFETLGLGPDDVDLIVCSDAEEILGIGDWGVNGTDIAIGKLAIYTAAAGVDPSRVIAVNLDVGTDNEDLLNSPFYLGNRHARVRGERYDNLISEYLRIASDMFPNALLHFEDFGPSHARRILRDNADSYRIFNDDMQGTGAIVTAAVMAGMKANNTTFADQRLVVYGAGTAGTGMADQIRAGMIRDGLSEEEATRRIWLIDVNGLVTDDMDNLPDYQQTYARPASEVKDWGSKDGKIGLLDVVRHAQPTILIGTSTDHGAFTEPVIREMAKHCDRPIVLPLSNPTSRIEAMPADVVRWSDGRALVAAGIPVDDFEYNDVTYEFGQGNNALLYPGLGLGVIVSRADRVTDGMLLAAASAVAKQVDASQLGAPILPPVENLRASSARVAEAVICEAVKSGVAHNQPDNVVEAVRLAMWWPEYPDELAMEHGGDKE